VSGGDALREAVVEKIVEGGIGLARVGDRTVFLPLAAAGDRVRFETVRERGTRIEGRIVEVVAPSAARVAPPCSLYGTCGGCQLQHLGADVQLETKRLVALETLARLGRVEPPGPVAIVPSPAPLGYRHRATFHVDWAGARPIAGFHRFRSHQTVDVAACPLLSETLNGAFRIARDALLPLAHAARPERMEIAHGEDGRFEVGFGEGAAPGRPAAEALAAAARALPALRALRWEPAAGAPETLHDAGPPLAYRVPDAAGGDREIAFDLRVFTQANLAANRLLVEAILAAAAAEPPRRVLDLHAGCGNLSLPLLARAEEAHLVDTNGPALAHAERSAGALRARASVSLGRAEEVAARLAAAGARFDLVLLDPPRQGAAAVVRPVAALAPPRVLYVSCSLPTLARDLALFARAGYRLAALRLFDFYPQTAHVEALADLRREAPAPGQGTGPPGR
jgi:23S rRNA (uracil1939-C5)-methyltransferase